MRPLILVLTGVLSISVMLGSSIVTAAADGPPRHDRYSTFLLKDQAKRNKKSSSQSDRTRLTQRERNRLADIELMKREAARFKAELARYRACMATNAMNVTMHCTPPTPPERLTPHGYPTGDPVISDEDAAYLAVARLRLTPPKPMITPEPDKNKWKMAAVGFPLWLSVAGDTSPPGVSDAIANVRVSLNARVDSVTFAMGDGHSVSCRNVTTRWNSSIEPGKPSPVCGYAYQKPSLPRGDYTVTAITHWSVAWSTSRASGVIDFVQNDSMDVPVGELQVLVR